MTTKALQKCHTYVKFAHFIVIFMDLIYHIFFHFKDYYTALEIR